MNLAVPALEDPPVRTRVAHVAGPLDEGVVRLDHLERMGTGVGDCHDIQGVLVSQRSLNGRW